jgi:hypothetical protein
VGLARRARGADRLRLTRERTIDGLVFLVSLVIVWLGLKLAHG